MKRSLCFLLVTAICFCLPSGIIFAQRDTCSEQKTFLETLTRDGYAEVGKYKVEKIIDNVYHMDESTLALPGGSTDSDGNMNNPSSIYFVIDDEEVLIIDSGNPASEDKETDAKIITEALTAGKPVTIAYTHGHGDHTGLARSSTVFENVNVKRVYIAQADLPAASEAIAQFADITYPLKDGDTFIVANKVYSAFIVNAHTDGSLMITNTDRELLIVGDTFGSGFVWIFWDTTEGTPLLNLSNGVAKARDIMNSMSDPTVLAGHRWQQFWDQNAQHPGEITIQYFNDMAQVISGLLNGSTLKEDYPVREGGIELSSNGARAKIDTLPKYVDAYLDAVNKIDEAYIYSAAPLLSIESSNATAAATFIVFPDGALTDEESQALLDETGITQIVDRAAATAYVARPSDGKSFTKEDISVFKAIAAKIYVTSNLKLVGFGNGATFINQNLTQYSNIFSGILSVGGEAGAEITTSVPAYISGNLDAALPYIAANNAVESDTQGSLTFYANPMSRFEIVVTNSEKESASAAFKNGWTQVLSKFGRIGNYIEGDNVVGTWYSRPIITGDDALDTSRKYQYFNSIDAINNIIRHVVTEDLNDNNILSLWYEYIPESSLNADKGTIPVVFLMHGNTNDPRTQYDSSGWAAIASREGIILVCPEWQGHTYQGYTYEPMTSDANLTPNADFVKVIEKVLAKYPQADPSRVYISGLSAGSRNTTNNGLANTKYFAAGAGQSGPFASKDDKQIIENIAMNKDQYDFPIIYFSGDKDEYLMQDFDKLEKTGALQVLQSFQELNDMKITHVEDLTSENIEIYGIPWEEKHTIEATEENIASMVGGKIWNEKGVEISMYRIYGWGHWNYPPDAELMWDFMKVYSRDPETGEILKKVITNQEPPSSQ